MNATAVRWKQCSVVAQTVDHDDDGDYVLSWRLRCGAVVEAQRRVPYLEPPPADHAPHRRKRWLWSRHITGTKTKPCPRCGGWKPGEVPRKREPFNNAFAFRRALSSPERTEALKALVTVALRLRTQQPLNEQQEHDLEELDRNARLAGLLDERGGCS